MKGSFGLGETVSPMITASLGFLVVSGIKKFLITVKQNTANISYQWLGQFILAVGVEI